MVKAEARTRTKWVHRFKGVGKEKMGASVEKLNEQEIRLEY